MTYQTKRTFDELMDTINKHHAVDYKKTVLSTYEFAKKAHEGVYRKSGEAYIYHPLRVAIMVADWGAEIDVIKAALLHDVVEDTAYTVDDIKNNFGGNVSHLVHCVTKIKAELNNTDGMTKEDLNRLSDEYLIRKMNRPALLIKIADRIDNLQTISCFSHEKQLRIAENTKSILIPMAKRAGAFMLVYALEDLCLQIEHPSRYSKISHAYQKLMARNQYSMSEMRRLLEDAFNTEGKSANPDLYPYVNCISEITYSVRSVASLYRRLIPTVSNFENEFDDIFNKKNIPLGNITIVVKNNMEITDFSISPLDIFFKVFESNLINNGITIQGFYSTTYNDSKFLIIRDINDNLYRLFIKSENEYAHYRFGDIMETSADFEFEDISSSEPSDTFNNKIKVFKADGTEMYIDAGATVLDFAFAIHTEIGLHFEYALIDDSKTKLPAQYKLTEGDRITIEHSAEIEPNIHWFKNVRTSKAVNKLIYYLSKSK